MITTLDTLQSIIGSEFTADIIKQTQMGDPDWLYDIVSELDHITPDSTFYLKDFHGPLLELNIKSDQIDCDAITAEIRRLSLLFTS